MANNIERTNAKIVNVTEEMTANGMQPSLKPVAGSFK